MTLIIGLQISQIFLANSQKSSTFRFELEHPGVQGITYSQRFWLQGWAIGKKSPIKAIEVIAQNRVIDEFPLKQSRPDVVKNNRDWIESSKNLGFSEELDLSKINNFSATRNLVTLQAIFDDGTKEELASIKFKYVIQDHLGPDFLIIGAMKAATSAIYKYLVQHPCVIQRQPKEVHFFSSNFHRGLEWYLTQFQQQINQLERPLLAGDASPSYLVVPGIAKRVFQLFPNIKIIISLRNSTERAISHYYHQVKRIKDDSRPIEEAFSDQELENSKQNRNSLTWRYLNNSYYASHVEAWLKVFPRDRVLILNYHDLATNPDGFIKDLFNFLDLHDFYPTVEKGKKIYANRYPPAPSKVIKRLDNYFESYDQDLENLLNLRLEGSYPRE